MGLIFYCFPNPKPMRTKNDVKRFVVYYQGKDNNNNYIECVGDNAIFQVDGRFGIATIRSRIVTGKNSSS